MKSDPKNVDHLIQLKQDEIRRYRAAIVNYPPARLAQNGIPFLHGLESQLAALYAEREKREL
jgi:hypothetical protein